MEILNNKELRKKLKDMDILHPSELEEKLNFLGVILNNTDLEEKLKERKIYPEIGVINNGKYQTLLFTHVRVFDKGSWILVKCVQHINFENVDNINDLEFDVVFSYIQTFIKECYKIYITWGHITILHESYVKDTSQEDERLRLYHVLVEDTKQNCSSNSCDILNAFNTSLELGYIRIVPSNTILDNHKELREKTLKDPQLRMDNALVFNGTTPLGTMNVTDFYKDPATDGYYK